MARWQDVNSFTAAELLNMGVLNEDIKKLKNGKHSIKKPWKYSKAFPNRAKFLKSFYMGANVGIKRKLEEDKQAAQQSDLATQINALVKVNDSAIQKYVEREYPKLGKKPEDYKPTWDGIVVTETEVSNEIITGLGIVIAPEVAKK